MMLTNARKGLTGQIKNIQQKLAERQSSYGLTKGAGILQKPTTASYTEEDFLLDSVERMQRSTEQTKASMKVEADKKRKVEVDEVVSDVIVDAVSGGEPTSGKDPAPVDSSTNSTGVMSRTTTDQVGSTLLDFIGKGEGGYDSANRGTASSGGIVGSQRVAERSGKRVSDMSIGEIREYQKIKDPNNPSRLFAVGKYQTIPSTLDMAVKGLGLSDDAVFTPEIQEKIGIYLVSEKRPKVGKYLRGEDSISVDDAMLDLAREFASIPVPRSVKKGTYGKWPKRDLQPGDSFYADPMASGGNAARHSIEETRDILMNTRSGK